MTDRGSTIDARETAGDLFAVACPACGKSLAAAVRDAGRVAKCPCCRARLLLPPLPLLLVRLQKAVNKSFQ